MSAVATIPDLLGTSPADLVDRYADQPQVSAGLARERAARIRAGLASYTQMRQDIADAYAQRDYTALGYPSWFAYVEAEFGEALRQLGRSERREAVSDLRGQGMSTRQIASATGTPRSTVRDDLQVGGIRPPDVINGTDGKSYAASRPSTSSGQSLPPGTEAKPEPAPESERPKPLPWDPEERRQHEEEVRRKQDISAPRRRGAGAVRRRSARRGVPLPAGACRMSGFGPGTIAAADQAMRDATLDLNDSLARVREYLAAGHDPAEAFLSLLANFKAFLDAGRPELVAGTAAVAVLWLANGAAS